MKIMEKTVFGAAMLSIPWFVIGNIVIDEPYFVFKSVYTTLFLVIVGLNVYLYRKTASDKKQKWHAAWANTILVFGYVLWFIVGPIGGGFAFTNGMLIMLPVVAFFFSLLRPVGILPATSFVCAALFLMAIKALTHTGPLQFENKVIEDPNTFYNLLYGFSHEGVAYAFSNTWALFGMTILLYVLVQQKKKKERMQLSTSHVQEDGERRVADRRQTRDENYVGVDRRKQDKLDRRRK